jgi:FkbM family methyltransferase
MKKRYKIFRHFLKKSPYEMVEKKERLAEKQQRLPEATFETIKLVLAFYSIVKPNATFVQIGAYDGQTNDPSIEYVQAGKLKCLLVEPIETSFKKLKKVYEGAANVHLINAAISNSDGEMTMYKVRQGSPSERVLPRGDLSSFDRNHLLRYGINESDIEPVRVPALTLKSLLARAGMEKIDVLQTDTEGFDAEVVKMALALDRLPDCINFENVNLNPETRGALYELLTQKGYLFTHDNIDTLALHSRLTEELLALSRGKATG